MQMDGGEDSYSAFFDLLGPKRPRVANDGHRRRAEEPAFEYWLRVLAKWAKTICRDHGPWALLALLATFVMLVFNCL